LKKPTPCNELRTATPSITRRDFLGSTLLASGAVLLNGMTPRELLAQADDFTGYGGVGEYKNSNGNTWPVLEAGHTIRDGTYDPLPKDIIDTGETYDCVIIGGGISGLAAALFFQRQAGSKVKSLILENHPIFGGEAKQNEFLVDGRRLIAHQGSISAQLSRRLLRFHWTKDSQTHISEMERARSRVPVIENALRGDWAAARTIRILVRDEIRSKIGNVADRSFRQETRRRTSFQRNSR
jgi:hypothetical protein